MVSGLAALGSKGMGGVLHLDEQGRDYGVRVQFPPNCVVDQHKQRWVRAATMLHERAGEWLDDTHVMGPHLSPLVEVEMQSGTELNSKIVVEIPHSAADGVSPADVVVVYCDPLWGKWVEVAETHWELRSRTLVVCMEDTGVVGMFCRRERRISQRIRCHVATTSKLIPLELAELSVRRVGFDSLPG